MYHLIHSIYSEYAKNSNATCILHTTYSYYLNFQIGNYHMALQELNSAEKCEASFQQKFTIFRSTKMIEDHLIHKYGKGGKAQRETSLNGRKITELDVMVVITFDGLFIKINKEIEKSANDHIEFWSHLDSQMIDLNVLHKLGLNIINNTKRINELWGQLNRINPKYPKALSLFGNYLLQIKNDVTEGEELLMKAHEARRTKSVDADPQEGVP